MEEEQVIKTYDLLFKFHPTLLLIRLLKSKILLLYMVLLINNLCGQHQ